MGRSIKTGLLGRVAEMQRPHRIFDHGRKGWYKYSEVQKMISNLTRISRYTEMRMACEYHGITQAQALEEAMRMWLDVHNWEEKKPRFLASKKEQEELSRLPAKEKGERV